MNRISVCQNWFSGLIAAAVLLGGTAEMLPHGSLDISANIIPFLAGSTLMLIGFFFALWESKRKKTPLIVLGITAIAARVLLLWQAPGDDIYRYIWEGKLLLNHLNPYLYAPDAMKLSWLHDSLWNAVEHKEFSAIYPPLAECFFAGLASISSSVLCFKLAFAGADLLTGCLLLRRYGGVSSLLYLWNPLVIYSFAGGGHYDSLFILAMVLGWLAWEREKQNGALLWVGVAVALKWMALPILCWMVWQILWKRGIRAGILAGLIGILPLLIAWITVGLWSGEWTWRLYPQKFTEYARSAEFIPRIVGWLWEKSMYHNEWILAPLAMAWALVIFKAKKFVAAAEWSLFFALIMSPMVHAWYFTWLMPFAVVSRNLGCIMLSASAFVYFGVYNHMHAQSEREWTFTLTEIILLWGPFILGFLWTYCHSVRGADFIEEGNPPTKR